MPLADDLVIACKGLALVVWGNLLREALFLVQAVGPSLLSPSIDLLGCGYTDAVPVPTYSPSLFVG